MIDTEEDATDTQWWRWVKALMVVNRVDNAYTLAKMIGATSAVTSKWKNGGLPRPETVVTIARIFNVPLQEGLIAAGIGGPADYDYKGESSVMQIASLKNSQLLELLASRLPNDDDDTPVDTGRTEPVKEPRKAARRRTQS